MSFCRVSVVIPCYKSKGSIGRAVDSVFKQTLLPDEVILVDDCSPDDTLVELESLRDKYPVGWIKVISLAHNVGAGSARNRGWEVATCDYIAFLDSDDSWHPRKIEVQLLWMQANRQAALTGHACLVVKNQDHFQAAVELSSAHADFEEVSGSKLLLSNRFATPSVMLKRDLPLRFEEGKRHSEDYLLWLEIALAGEKCYRSPAELSYLHKASYGESGLSSNLWKMELGELDSYIKVYNKGMIGLAALVPLFLLSLAKYLRRVLRVFLRKVFA